jgi:hypothetical protein
MVDDVVPRARIRLKQHIGEPPIWVAQKFHAVELVERRRDAPCDQPALPQRTMVGFPAAEF